LIFPSGFPHQYPICIPLLPHSCYMPCPRDIAMHCQNVPQRITRSGFVFTWAQERISLTRRLICLISSVPRVRYRIETSKYAATASRHESLCHLSAPFCVTLLAQVLVPTENCELVVLWVCPPYVPQVSSCSVCVCRCRCLCVCLERPGDALLYHQSDFHSTPSAAFRRSARPLLSVCLRCRTNSSLCSAARPRCSGAA
jgi:hypothetical protein